MIHSFFELPIDRRPWIDLGDIPPMDPAEFSFNEHGDPSIGPFTFDQLNNPWSLGCIVLQRFPGSDVCTCSLKEMMRTVS